MTGNTSCGGGPMSTIQYPIRDVNLVPRACDPSEPLVPGDVRYANWNALRQGIGSADLERDLKRTNGSVHHGTLCGHRGCGKSTELLRLKAWADQNGFLAVHTEVDTHLGQIDLQFPDLFLLAATTVESAMKEFGEPLADDLIKQVVAWFDDIVKEDKETLKSELSLEVGGQLGGKLPFGLAKLFAKFTSGLKAGSDHVLKVRSKIRNYPDSLIALTNNLLFHANKILKEKGREKGILLMFDNLDRYDPDQIDKVLFKSSELIRRLRCHAIFTIPIGLEYHPSGPTQDEYDFSVVLPMLALRKKQQPWNDSVASSRYCEELIAEVREGLSKRLQLDVLFSDLALVDRLIRYSGGCIRDLMHLIKMTYRYCEGDQFDENAVNRAIQSMQSTYIRRLNDKDYQRLAQIAKRNKAVPRDELTDRLLYHRHALEYLDDNNKPWLDVRPLVVEIEEFRDALGAL